MNSLSLELQTIRQRLGACNRSVTLIAECYVCVGALLKRYKHKQTEYVLKESITLFTKERVL